MAFSDLGSIGATGSTSNNQSTLALTTTRACAVGEFVVVVVADDNIGTGADADGSEVASVADNAAGGSNTWQKAQGWTNTQGGAQAGAHVSLWYTTIVRQINNGGTITATFTNATLSDATAMTGRAFSFAAGTTVAIEGTPGTLSNDGADPGALDVTTRNLACLRIRGIGGEVGNNTSLTASAGGWQIWANGNSATTGTTGEMCARAEHLISTATGASSNPTWVACDNASVYVAFREFTQTTIQPVSSDLVLSSVAPDLARTLHVTISVPAGDLALSKFAPTVLVFDPNFIISVPSGNLTFSTFVPDRNYNARYWVGGTATWDATVGTKWSYTSGGTGGVPVPTATDNVYLDASSGAVTVTISGTRACRNFDCTGFTGTLAGTATPALTVSGLVFTLGSGMTITYTGITTFDSTSGNTLITSNGKVPGPIIMNGLGGTFTLQDDLTLVTGGECNLTAGTFDMNGQDLSCGTFSSSNTNVRSIIFGGTMTLTATGTVFTISSGGNLTVNDTAGTIDITNSSASSVTFTGNAGHNLPHMKRSAGSGNLTLNSIVVKDLDFTGFSGALQSANQATVRGNLTFSATMSVATGSSVLNLTPPTGTTKTADFAGVLVDRPVTLNGLGTTQLNSDLVMTSTRTLTLTSGTLDANNFDVTCGNLSSSNSNVRGITMGSGTWTLTGSGAFAWDSSTFTNMTLNAGASTLLLTYSGGNSIGVRAGSTAVFNHIRRTAGTGTFIISTGVTCNDLDFTGFAGTWIGGTNVAITIHGHLTLASGMIVNTDTEAVTLAPPVSTTKVVTSNGVQLKRPVHVDGAGTVQFADDFSTDQGLFLDTGGLDADGNDVTVRFFTSNSGNTRVLTMGAGTWTITESLSGDAWTIDDVTGLTQDIDTSTIVFSGPDLAITSDSSLSYGSISFTDSGGIAIWGGPITAASVTLVGGFHLQFDDHGQGLDWDVASLTAGSSLIEWTEPATITSNGQSFYDFRANGFTGTITLADALSVTHDLQIAREFDANDQNVMIGGTALIADSGVNFVQLDMGSGTWTLTGTGTVLNFADNSGGTVNAETSTIKLTDSSATDKTFVGGDLTYNNFWNATGSTGAVIIEGSNTFNDFKIDAGRIQLFQHGETQTLSSLTVPVNPSNGITIDSDDGTNTHTLSKASGTVTVYGTTINNSIATGGATWNAFTTDGNIDGGGNTGWNFTSTGAIDIPTTDLILTTNAPERVTDFIRGPPSADLVLSTFAPAVTIETASLNLSPVSSALTLTTSALDVVNNTVRDVPSANLTLTASTPDCVHAVTINAQSANLTLSASAPDRVVDTFRTPVSADLVLSVFVPTVTRADTISVPSANLTLTTSTPIVETGLQFQPISANLTLTTSVPDRVHAVTIQPDSGNLTLTTFVSSKIVDVYRESTSANLTLSGFASAVLHAVTVAVPSANLTLTTGTPITSGAGEITIPAGDLTLTTSVPDRNYAVTIAVPSTNLTLTTSAPEAVVSVVRDVPSADLTLSTFAVTSLVDTYRESASANLVLSTFAPTTLVAFNRDVPAANLTLSTSAPTVSAGDDRSIEIPAADLTLTTSVPTLTAAGEIAVQSANLILTTSVPDRVHAVTIAVSSADLTLSTFAPTVTFTDNHSVAVPSANLTLSAFPPDVSATQSGTIQPQRSDLALTTSAPTVTWTDNRAVAVPSTNLSLSSVAPDRVVAVLRDVPSANLVFSAFAPSVVVDTARAVPSANLTLTASSPDRVTNIIRAPVSGNLTLTTSVPQTVVNTVREPLATNLALSAFAPNLAQTFSHYPDIPVGTLALSASAPGVLWTNHRTVFPLTRDLVLSPFVPVISIDVADPILALIPTVNLVLSGRRPKVAVHGRHHNVIHTKDGNDAVPVGNTGVVDVDGSSPVSVGTSGAVDTKGNPPVPVMEN